MAINKSKRPRFHNSSIAGLALVGVMLLGMLLVVKTVSGTTPSPTIRGLLSDKAGDKKNLPQITTSINSTGKAVLPSINPISEKFYAHTIPLDEDNSGDGSESLATDDRGQIHTRSSSRIPAPTPNDGLFVIDAGPDLDTGCVSRNLEIDLEVTRYVGPVNGQGFLQSSVADDLIENNILAPILKLELPAYDVDFDYSGDSPERDRVSINGEVLGYLRGQNGEWQWNTFDIPITKIKFPAAPPEGGTVTPRKNRIKIDVDILDGGWCTEIDWIALSPSGAASKTMQPLAWRPVLFAHGINSDKCIWISDPGECSDQQESELLWGEALDDLNIKNHAINMGRCDSIQNNSAKIANEVDIIKRAYGVDKVRLVGHSKGGIDSRHYISQGNNDVESLIQLASPNAGSPLADYIQGIVISLLGPIPTALIDLFATPCGYQLTTAHMAAYNLVDTPGSNTSYTAVAGNHDPEGLCSGNCLMLGPDDMIVQVSSAHALGYATNLTHASSDGSASHTGIHGSSDVYANTMNVIKQPSRPLPSATRWIPKTPRTVAHPKATFHPLTQTTNEQFLATKAGFITNGNTVSHTLAVDSDGEMTVQLMWGIDNLDLTLEDPLGNTIDPGTAVQNPNIEFNSFEEFDGLRYETYRLQNAISGNWKAFVTGTLVSAAVGEGYGISTRLQNSSGSQNNASSLNSGITLNVENDFSFYNNDQPITVTAILTDTVGPITDAAVNAKIVWPDLTFSEEMLFDDGTHGDPVASDGMYTLVISDTTQPGAYRIQVVAERFIGQVFSREQVLLATVSQSTSAFSNIFADAGVDTDSDSLFNELDIDIQVDVDSAESYRITGQLRDMSDNLIATTFISETLPTGTQTVTLTFDGNTIYEHGENGPYKITQLTMAEADDSDLLLVDFIPDAYTTASYQLSDFQSPNIVLTGSSTDDGIDFDADSYFDVLSVTVDINLRQSMAYNWSAELVDANGTLIDLDAQTGELNAGQDALYLNFDGAAIVENRADGPYFVKNLLIYASSGNQDYFAAADVAETAAYSIFEFDTDFALIVEPTTTSVCAPDPASYNVDLGQLSGHTEPATVSVVGAPVGTATTYTPNPLTPPGRSMVVITDTQNAAVGQYEMGISTVTPTTTNSVSVTMHLFNAVPGVVVPLEPLDGDEEVGLSPHLVWQAATQAMTYQLEVAADSAFSDIIYSTSVADTNHTVNQVLELNTIYYWRIYSENGCGSGEYGPTFSFKTADLAELSISKTASAEVVNVGDTITYTISVTNTGTAAAENTIVTETLPAALIPGPRVDYALTAAPFNWQDISSTGTVVAQGNDVVELVDIGFPFSFYGITYTQMTVDSNGYITFDAPINSYYFNNAIPNEAEPNNAIYAFWADLYPFGGVDGNVFVEQTGPTTTIIQWQEVAFYNTKETFQIILDGSNNSITLQYQDVADAASATAGVENAAGFRGTQLANFDIGIILSGTAYSFLPEQTADVVVTTQGCAEDPVGVPTCSLGTLNPGNSAQYTVAATARDAGYFFNTVHVAADAPDAFTTNNSATAYNGFLATSADLSVTKVDQVDPVAQGNDILYTITVNNTGPADARNVIAIESLPSALQPGVQVNYAATAVPINWQDISATGTVIAQGDDTYELFNIGFPFSFYGITYTQIFVDSNGYLAFEDFGFSEYSHEAIPSSWEPNNAIYALWTDLSPL